MWSTMAALSADNTRTGRDAVTADALRNYVQQLEESKATGRHIVMVALDLLNAFNRAWMSYILKQLKK